MTGASGAGEQTVSPEIACILAGAKSVRLPFETPHFEAAWFNIDWALAYSADLAGLRGYEGYAGRAIEIAAERVTMVDPAACPYAGQYDEMRRWIAVDALLTRYRESRMSAAARARLAGDGDDGD